MLRMLVALVVLTSCSDRSNERPPLAAAPEPTTITRQETRTLDEGIQVREVLLKREGVPMTVWIYRSATPPAARRPLVVIGAAGSPLVAGMELSEGDRMEHLPWAERGYVVVAYSIDGALSELDDGLPLYKVRAFMRADGGVANARAALDFALTHEADIDPTRIYAVGHSSAATLALTFGAQEPRVAAIVAFNGTTDVRASLERSLGHDVVLRFTFHTDGVADLLRRSSPMTHAAALRTKPVFLFHSAEDDVVPITELDRLAVAMTPAHAASRIERVPTGDHYGSMIDQGLPLAIEWTSKLPPAPR